MKKTTLCGLSIVLCLMALVLGVGAQRRVTYTPVRLAVRIESADSSLTTTQIRCDGVIQSDGSCDYYDGADGVAASLDQHGNLIIDFQTTSTPLRRVDFDYSTPFIPNGPEPPSGLQADSYLATLKRNEDSAYVALQNMAVGTAQCVRLGWTFDSQDGTTQWRNSFQRNLSPFDISQTSYGIVTRTDADTWEVEPKGSSCSNPPSSSSSLATVARVSHSSTRGKSVHTDDGLYYMPFKLTLRRRV